LKSHIYTIEEKYAYVQKYLCGLQLPYEKSYRSHDTIKMVLITTLKEESMLMNAIINLMILFICQGTVIGWSSLLNSIGYSDQCKYYVVTRGDVIAKLTCREMLFSSLCDFGIGCIIAVMCPLDGICILHHCSFLDLADFVLAPLCWLLVGLLEVHYLCFPHSLASLLRLDYFLLLPEVSKMSCNPSLHDGTLFCHR
jgi:hypothetical protein